MTIPLTVFVTRLLLKASKAQQFDHKSYKNNLILVTYSKRKKDLSNLPKHPILSMLTCANLLVTNWRPLENEQNPCAYPGKQI